MLARAAGEAGLATGASLLRVLACRTGGASTGALLGSRQASSSADSSDRPLSGDPGVRQARRQQPSSIVEPPLLHDSLSEADYSHYKRQRPTARMSSISEPDYYLNNSLSEGTYGMPAVLQHKRTQGSSMARSKPMPMMMQRIVVVNRSAAQEDKPERLHDSFSAVDYSNSR